MAGSFTYKSYNFTEKDPIIDEIRTVVQQHGSTYKDIHEHSGVSTATLTNWFTGPTKRPQAASINAVLRSMGWKLGVVPYDTKSLVLPTPAPPPAPVVSTRHVVKMAHYRKARGRR